MPGQTPKGLKDRLFIKVILGLLALTDITLDQAEGSAVTTTLLKVTYAYSWTTVDPKLDHIIPFYWLRLSDLSDLDSAVLKAKTATDAMPVGHKVLFSWDLHREMSHHPLDALRDPFGNPVGYTDREGRFKPYHGIWWDHGVEVVRNRFDEFFSRYAALGGQVDVMVLDFEEGFSNWHLENKANREYGGNAESYFLAIQNDPRFEPVRQELNFGPILTVTGGNGVTILYGSKFDSLRRESGLSSLLAVLRWSTNEDYLKWNALMQDRAAAYVNKAVYEPIRKYFPDVKMSNYGYYHYSQEFPVPDRNGHLIYKYGDGAHVGTHQSYELYGWMGRVEDLKLDGTHFYTKTPFNAFRYEVNKLRAMKLSSEVPIYPWVSYKEFDDSLLRQSDLYQELIFHAGLTGVENFLFWNPTDHVATPATPSSNALLNDCLKQLEDLIGFEDRETLVKGLVGWGDDYVLTGMRAKGRSVWRFTPKLEGENSLESVLVRTFPATFQVGSTTVTIPEGRVFIPENIISRQGYWVIAQ